MLDFLNDLINGKILIAVLIPLGLIFTIWSRGVQFRLFGSMFSVLGQGFQHETDQPSSFQALALSVAGRVGGGNIAGVAAALALGGPGAIFWMWIVGLVGMATSYFECTLAQVYKQKEPNGDFRGGPAYYIKHGLGKKLGGAAPVLGFAYSLLLLVTFGFAFICFQSFATTSSMDSAFGAPRLWSGIGLGVVVSLVIFGGVRRIASVAEIIVPVMAVFYALLGLYVLLTHLPQIPAAFSTIFLSAFGFNEAVAGGIGGAIMMGVNRGLFSNEAGLGSAPNVAAAAYVEHPAQQGMVQSLSVFIDTIIMCTVTALIIILSTQSYIGVDDEVQGVLTQLALADHVGDWAEFFIAFALFLFAFSSIMYSYYLGENAVDYYIPDNMFAVYVYRFMVIGFVLLGSTIQLGDVLSFSDVTMGLLAIVNLFAVALLFPIGLRVMRDFDAQRKAGVKVPVFDPDQFDDLDIDKAAWQLTERSGGPSG
ncbi:alanine/glycine:cation symporter family protein [Henriciella sp.]|uniref:alanine/glycine:cation symporter family protein n=1 Tax=Henriciella sp. TaxID=1968823 RepID=UPI003C70D500